MNKFILLCSFLALTLCSCAGGNTSSSSSSSHPYVEGLWDESQDNLRNGIKTIQFYNINDFHGATEFSSELGEPGMYKLASYIKSLKKQFQEENFVLTSSGDMWQGSAESNLTYGKLVIDWMHELGFSAMAIGNHEFDWKIDKIIENQLYDPSIPYLACNILDKSTNKPVDWAKPYTTITKNGVHIGIIGAIGENLTSSIVSSYVEDVKFVDPTPYVKQHATFLKENGADIILYLQHNDMSGNGKGADNFSSELYNSVDLCFAGHSHTKNDLLITYGNKKIPIIQAYSNGKDIGHITMSVDFSGSRVDFKSKQIIRSFASDLSKYDDDPNSLMIYQKYKEDIEKYTLRVVGHTDERISNYGELESYVNKYSYRYYIDETEEKYPISLIKNNNARSPLKAGDITYGDIYKSLPFDNYLVVLKVKGAFLMSENYFMTYYSEYDYYPRGKEFKEEETYYILTINYISEKYYYYMDDNRPINHYDLLDYYMVYPRDIVSTYIGEDFPIR